MPDPYDLIVIGTGAAGAGPAMRCRKAGQRVAVVDDEPYGGTCALRGCDPKKVLVGEADLLDWHRRMLGYGINDAGVHIEWPALTNFKRTFTDAVPSNSETAFRKAGVETYHGVAQFVGADVLRVGGQQLSATHFVIASGAEPRRLDIPGEEHVKTSTDFLRLERLPPRIVLIGAGYIAFEFAHLAQRAGAHVTVLGRTKALAHFEQDLVRRLIEHSRSIGIDVRLNSPVTKIAKQGSAYRVHFQATTHDESIDGDLVVHAAGRVPKTRQLELDRANVATDERGAVVVNEYLQSVSNPRVYAAGDVALPPGSLPLTPVGAHEGLIAAANLLHGNTRKPDYRGIPSVVFSIPALARVGITEDEARASGRVIRVKSENTANWLSNRRVRETAAMFKTIVEEGADRILGAHLLGPNAEDVINIFALAIRHNISATDLSHMIYAYPTSSSDVAYML